MTLAVISAAFFFFLKSGIANMGKSFRFRNFRISAFVVLAIFHVAVFTNAYGVLTGLQTTSGLKPEDYSWRQVENYADNGFVAGFFTNVGNALVEKPVGYERAEVEKNATLKIESSAMPSDDVRPDVVLLLSESFWDPTKLP